MNFQNKFKLSAVALAVSLSTAIHADTLVSDIDNVNIVVDNNDGSYGAFTVTKGVADPTSLITSDVNLYGGTSINTNTAVNGNLTVNGGTAVNGNLTVNGGASNIINAGTIATGADLIIPTVNAAFAGTTQNFNQDRVDAQDQTRTVDAQVIDQNKFQLTTSEQVGQQSWTTSQSATADYDSAGVIIPGSLTGPVLGTTVDNGFVATTVDKVQDLTLGRNNSTEDYQLSISKTENSVTNSTTVNASGISTGQITLAGQDLATTIANGDAATLTAANLYTDGLVANEAATREAADLTLQANIDAEVATREAADLTLQANIDAETATREAADLTLQANIDAEAATREAADLTLQANIDAEAATREAADLTLQANIDAEAATRDAADQAIRADIAEKVTTNELEVNGPVTVNNVQSTTTIDQAGTPATTPEFGADLDADGRPDTLLQTKEQTDAVTVNSQSQVYNENNLTFSSTVEKGTTTTTDQYVADITYDENGVATYGPNTALGQTVTSDLEVIAEDSIIVGKESADSQTALTVRSKDTTGEYVTVVTSKEVATGNVSASTITLDGQDLTTTIVNGDTATLAAANDYTDTTAATLRDEAAAEFVRVNTAIVDGDAATLAAANANTASTAATLRGEAAAETARVNTAIVDGDVATLAAANANTASTAATLRGEAAAETARVNTAIVDGDVATLTAANAYTNTQVSSVNSRVNQLNSRVDDVEKTSYRGIAIALAAQQQIPNIGAGQFAVFGGVGHYEGESAAALGVASVFADGRTSVSAAVGIAGSNEIGGRVGVSYVFGGK